MFSSGSEFFLRLKQNIIKFMENVLGPRLDETNIEENIIMNEDELFMVKVKEISKDIGVDYRHLLAVMEFESRTNPQAVNKWSKATGLIQFMPKTAIGLGTTTEELLKMNKIQQLEYVHKYFKPFKGKLKTLSKTYMAVLWPRAARDPDPDPVLFRKGTKAYEQNPLDWNKDGVITESEASRKVQEIFDRKFKHLPPD